MASCTKNRPDTKWQIKLVTNICTAAHVLYMLTLNCCYQVMTSWQFSILSQTWFEVMSYLAYVMLTTVWAAKVCTPLGSHYMYDHFPSSVYTLLIKNTLLNPVCALAKSIKSFIFIQAYHMCDVPLVHLAVGESEGDLKSISSLLIFIWNDNRTFWRQIGYTKA